MDIRKEEHKGEEPEDNAPENEKTCQNHPKSERRLKMPSTRTCEQIAVQADNWTCLRNQTTLTENTLCRKQSQLAIRQSRTTLTENSLPQGRAN